MGTIIISGGEATWSPIGVCVCVCVCVCICEVTLKHAVVGACKFICVYPAQADFTVYKGMAHSASLEELDDVSALLTQWLPEKPKAKL